MPWAQSALLALARQCNLLIPKGRKKGDSPRSEGSQFCHGLLGPKRKSWFEDGGK